MGLNGKCDLTVLFRAWAEKKWLISLNGQRGFKWAKRLKRNGPCSFLNGIWAVSGSVLELGQARAGKWTVFRGLAQKLG
jgi:hypothetical protein